MQVVYNPKRFKSKKEWKEVNSLIKDMDIDKAHDFLVENGYIEDNRLKVKDMIEFLKTFDPEARLVFGEMNSVDEGFWQHMVKFQLPMMFKTVKKEKEEEKRHYVQEERMTEDEIRVYTEKYEENIRKDFKYVKDEDIIVRI